MDAFLRDFGIEFASRYQGLRHDSGDPVAWGEKAIAHYEKLGIDPLTKTLVFSDNLDLQKAVELYRHFASRVQLSFGIGTRLTCDIPQVKPLNIVIKLVECNGKPVAKLSDSPVKRSVMIKRLCARCVKPLISRRSAKPVNSFQGACLGSFFRFISEIFHFSCDFCLSDCRCQVT